MGFRRLLAVLLLALPLSIAAEKTAEQIYKDAVRAEHDGQIAQAYILYAEAAAKDPANRLYWLRAEALRPVAAAAQPTPETAPPHAETPLDPTLFGKITDREIVESRKLLPPPELKVAPTRKDFDLRGDARSLYEQVAKDFNLLVIFDVAYQPRPSFRFVIQDANYRDALEALNAATGSFIVPGGDRLILVANDTPQKRTELELNAAVVIPIPEPFTIQEVQEIATGIRGTLDIQRLMVDTQRRLLLVRDRVSKVLLAQKMVQDLMKPKAQFAIDVELISSDRTSSLTYGLDLPTSVPLVWVPASRNNITTVFPSGFANFIGFGGGRSHLALGVTSASLFATATKSYATTLIHSEVVTSDGTAASLHIGDKYPIITAGYFGTPTGSGQVYTPPPTFNFEDLGLVLKVTPHVHGEDEVTLELTAEFKLLGGTAINGIPIVQNRKFESKVRIRNGEWAVLAGLMTATEGKTITGLPGLSAIPFLHKDKRNKDEGETLVILKPHLLSLPPSDANMRAAWVGTESRPHTQL